MTANAPLGAADLVPRRGPMPRCCSALPTRDDLASLPGGDCPEDVAITVIGVASNLLVRDGGIPGRRPSGWVRSFARRLMSRAGRVHRGALVRLDLDRGAGGAAMQALTGLEFLSGIPGTIGGAVFR